MSKEPKQMLIEYGITSKVWIIEYCIIVYIC